MSYSTSGLVITILKKIDTVDPVVGNDDTQGYAVQSRWVNTSSRKEWVCMDASTGAAVWTETTGGGTGGAFGFGIWTYTAAAPAAGEVQANFLAIGSTTQFVVHQDSVGGMRYRELMAKARVGDVLALVSADGSEGGTFDIVSITEGASTVTFVVTLSNSAGTNWSGDYSIAITPGAAHPPDYEYGIGSWTYVGSTPNSTGEFQPNFPSAASTSSVVFFHDPNEGGRVRVALEEVGIGSHLVFRSADDVASVHTYRVTAIGSTATTITYTMTVTNTVGQDTWSLETAWGLLIVPGPADVVGPGGSTNNRIAIFDSSTGKLLKDSSDLTEDAGIVQNASATATQRIKEKGTAASNVATYGDYWVKTATPNRSMFTDDAGLDIRLGTNRIIHSGEPNPNLDTWRSWGENSGPYNIDTTAWASNAGSSGTGSITIDPSFDRWDMGFYFPEAVTITSIKVATSNQGAHASFEIYYQWWSQVVADGATANGAQTKVANLNYTVDGTANKAYKKTATLDNATIAAGEHLMMFWSVIAAAGTGEVQRFYCTIDYTID